MTRLPRWGITAGAIAGVTVLPATSMFGSAAASEQQAGRPQFRMNVDLVTVDVSVRDGNLPVNGLTAEDFILTDNGVQQDIDVADLSSLPIDVTVVIDTSGSMAGDIDAVVAQARAAANLLQPGDQIRTVSFAHDVTTGRFRTIEHGNPLEPVQARGATALADGLAMALMNARVDERRHLVIAYTDGGDNFSAVSGRELELISRRTDSVLHVLQVYPTLLLAIGGSGLGLDWRLDTRTRWYPPRARRMVWTLGEIARNTGGDIRGIGVIGESTTAIGEVIRLFRESYVLSYRATGVEMPGWHDIRVRVASRGGLTVRARRGYFVGPARR